ncbi:MAG: methylated-DNA--[protein]-cysteine S-methyltransferase [Myxococcota bacterium]|nr:methylated-DNA--[protein]-cysteine S-methyltransferase [Myxococcota bacterium]
MRGLGPQADVASVMIIEAKGRRTLRAQPNSGGGHRSDATDEAVGQGGLDAPVLKGSIWLVWGRAGLLEVQLPGRHRPRPEVPVVAVPDTYAMPLRAYLSGADVDPARQVQVSLVGSPFERRVWRALRAIERGRVLSYGAVARALGIARGARAVGMAAARNPLAIVVPCHRLVETGHGLGGFSAGIPLKRALLRLEGVLVLGNKVLPGQLEIDAPRDGA